MKKVFSITLVAAVIAVSLSGCIAFHSGSMTGSASLNSANFSYVKQNISSDATAKYILGIGGLSKQTLVDNAKQQLIAANPLQSNQALANVTVNFKNSLYFGIIYRTLKCTVTADVVEFNK
jgi:hypothetical protein